MFLAILVIFVILVALMPVIAAFVPSKDKDPGHKRAKTYEEEFRGKKYGQELYDDLWDDDLF